jgi:hypothetical protein
MMKETGTTTPMTFAEFEKLPDGPEQSVPMSALLSPISRVGNTTKARRCLCLRWYRPMTGRPN